MPHPRPLGLSACVSTRATPDDPKTAPAGLYDSTFRRLALTAPDADGQVIGAYRLDGGRHTGTSENGVLSGVRAETMANGDCSPTDQGHTYYGTFIFRFADDLGSFDGTWGDCDGAELQDWDGQYRGPAPD